MSLDSVLIRFQQGASPERIVQSFPTLKLSQVYGAIAYYPENEKAIGEYIAEGERELEQSAAPLSQTNPELFARLEAAADRWVRNALECPLHDRSALSLDFPNRLGQIGGRVDGQRFAFQSGDRIGDHIGLWFH